MENNSAEQLVADVNQLANKAEQPGTFDAGQFLQAAGYKLLDSGPNPRSAKVMSPDGQEGIMDLTGIMKEAGIPESASVQLNTPQTAFNRSPLSLQQRLATSFGNAKGNLDFLKKNYQDVQMNSDGDFLVKQNGAWYKADATALGDGTGWDMAKELVSDTAELARTGIEIGASLAGSAAGAAAGTALAVPIQVVPGAGQVAGAATILGGRAIGSGLASGIASAGIRAAGRFLGTYEASPQEMARDVLTDAALGLAGEVVAMGAQKAVIPAMASGIKKLAASADESTRGLLAKFLQTTTNGSEVAANHMISSTEAATRVTNRMQAAVGMGREIAEKRGAPMNDQFAREAAKQMQVTEIKPILEGAQERLSSIYRSNQAKAINAIDDAVDVVDNSEAIRTGFDDMVKLGFLKSEGQGFRPATAEELTSVIGNGIGSAETSSIQRQVGSFLYNANRALDPTEAPSAKEAARRGFEMVRDLRSLAEDIPNPNAKEIVQQMTSGMSNRIRAALPQAAQTAANNMDSHYAANISFVKRAEKALAAGDGSGVDSFISQFKNQGSQAINRTLDSLTGLMGKEEGQLARRNFMDALAAEDVVSMFPTNSTLDGGSNILRQVARGSAALGATAALGPGAGLAVAGSASPQLTYKTVTAGMKTAAALGNTIRGLSEASRLSLLKNPTALSAFFNQAGLNLNSEQ